MAEVSQRLGKGAHRFSNIKNSHNRATFKGHGCLLTNGTSTRTVPAGRPISGHLPVSSTTTTTTTTSEEAEYRTQIHCRVGDVQEIEALLNVCHSATFLDSLSSDPDVNSSILQRREDMQKTLYRPLAVRPQLQMRLIGRVTLGNKRSVVMAATLHPEVFRSHQQLRGFSTLILKVTLAEQRSWFGLSVNGLSLNKLKHLTDSLQPSAAARFYSWSSNNSKSDAPPLHRSKTAYYDILRVTPNATQSQIKTAYYKQSFIYHPDKNQGNEEATQRFSEISEAYTVLGNKTLRRKYDRGIMSQSDIQGAGRPSSKETSKTSGSQQQQQQHASRRFSQAHGKPMFDFDAFFHAHYGEQLQREKMLKARREQMKQKQEEDFRKWKLGKMTEVTVGMLLAVAGILLISVTQS